MQQGKFINPITGKEVDEIIKEAEAKARGYYDYQFLLRYLEDENEFIKYFIIDGKKIVVDIAKPILEYKKKTNMDYGRILQTAPEKKADNISVPTTPINCDVDSQTSCVSCGS